MGLKLLKDRSGAYRRMWYAVMSVNGKRTTRALKTPLRGKIPLDASGTFSLDTHGDELFEASKAAARTELQEENQHRKTGGAESRRNSEALGIKTVRITDLADENARRKKYELVESASNFKYNRSVYDILVHFAKWTAERPTKRNAKKYHLIADIDTDLVAAYYHDICYGNENVSIAVKTKNGEERKAIQPLSWQSFRKYVFVLKSIFKHFTGGAVANPFEIAYTEYKGKKSEFGTKEEIAHKPPSTDEMRRIWDYAASIENKPYLHRLAVIAACSGLRMGDTCNLTWDRVDLKRGIIGPVKTLKTGAEVCVPIFDYDPNAKDYEPVFGELRRELEAALAERKDGEKFVTPEAARIYAYNPSRITEEGKTIFAQALAPSEHVEEAVLIGQEKPKMGLAEILAAIDGATWNEKRRERIRTVYQLHASGKTYRQIAEIIGKDKSGVSSDLAAVEDLTGETLRKGTTPQDRVSHSHNAKLLQATRQDRKQGQRAACLFGWHSCRMYFAGHAFYDIGMTETELAGITGHKTVKMVRHYIETSGQAAVAAAKRKNAERNNTKATVITQQSTPCLLAQTTEVETAARLAKLDALLAKGLITNEERNEQRARILAEI